MCVCARVCVTVPFVQYHVAAQSVPAAGDIELKAPPSQKTIPDVHQKMFYRIFSIWFRVRFTSIFAFDNYWCHAAFH